MDAGAAGRATQDGAGSCREHAAPVDHPTLMADESDERPVSGRLGDGMGQGQPINSMSGLCLFPFGCISGITVSAFFFLCFGGESSGKTCNWACGNGHPRENLTG